MLKSLVQLNFSTYYDIVELSDSAKYLIIASTKVHLGLIGYARIAYAAKAPIGC